MEGEVAEVYRRCPRPLSRLVVPLAVTDRASDVKVTHTYTSVEEDAKRHLSAAADVSA